MEGGQKNNIDLTSELDVKSSDMLVPVTAPKFQHNRQQYQGHVLPSSLRYEHDGWAAGNDVYTFEFDDVFVNTEPAAFKVVSYKLNNNPSYMVVLKEPVASATKLKDYAQLYLNLVADVVSVPIGQLKPTAQLVGGESVFEGELDGRHYKLTISPYTNSASVQDAADWSAVMDVMADGRRKITMEYKPSRVSADFELWYPAALISEDGTVFMAYKETKDGVHIWHGSDGSLATLNDGGTHLVSGGNEHTVTYDGSTNTFSVNLIEHFIDSLDINLSTKDIVTALKSIICEAPDKLHEKADSEQKFNQVKCSPAGTSWLTMKDPLLIRTELPVWVGVYGSFGKIDTDAEELEQIHLGDATCPAGSISVYLANKGSSTIKLYDRDAVGWNLKVYHGADDATDKYNVSYNDTSLSMRVSVKVSFCMVIGAVWYPARRRRRSAISYTTYPAGWYMPSDEWTQLINTEGADPVIYELTYSRVLSGRRDIDLLNNSSLNGNILVEATPVELPEPEPTDTEEGEETTEETTEELPDDYVPTAAWHIVERKVTGVHMAVTPLRARIEPNDTLDCWLTGYRFDFSGSGSGDNFCIKCSKQNITTALGRLKFEKDWKREQKSETQHDGMVTEPHAAWAAWLYGCMLNKIEIYSKADDKLHAQPLVTDFSDVLYSTTYATVDNTERIWLDRNGDGATFRGIDAFKVKLQSAVIDKTKQAGAIYMTLKDSGNGLAALFYSKPVADGEKKPNFFMPGHIFMGSTIYASADYGNMYFTSSMNNNITISGDADIYKVVSRVDTSWTKYKAAGHDFYENVQNNVLNSLVVTIGSIENKYEGTNYMSTQDISLSIGKQNGMGGVDMMSVLVIRNGMWQSAPLSTSADFSYDGYDLTFKRHPDDDPIELDNLSLWRAALVGRLTYKLTGAYPAVITKDGANYSLKSYTAGMAVVELANGKEATYSVPQKVAVYQSKKYEPIEADDEKARISFTGFDAYELVVLAAGAYRETNAHLTYIDSSTLQVEVDGTLYKLPIDELFFSGTVSKMLFKYTNVSDPLIGDHVIHAVVADDEFQFLRQQWDTTQATESFWWIDADHVLALLKHELVLREKIEELDDWYGDIFKDVSSWPRADVLPSSVEHFGCTNAYGSGQHALFWTTSLSGSGINIKFMDPLNMDPLNNMTVVADIELSIEHVDIGSMLADPSRPTVLRTYDMLQAVNVLSRAAVTATVIDGKILFGIHYDKNLNQWAFIVENGSVTCQILGYGFIGLNGDLTGGELPSQYFDDTYGYMATVLPLSALDSTPKSVTDYNAVYELNEMVVGTAEQQWYITKELSGIVSHLVWNGVGFKSVVLPITSNYSCKYESGSFSSRILSDYIPFARTMSSIFPSPVGQTDAIEGTVLTLMHVFFALGGEPFLYGVAPKFTVCEYLQQTAGQYGYVHYNSTKHEEETDLTGTNDAKVGHSVMDDRQEGKSVAPQDDTSITFDKVTVRQESQQKTTADDGMLGLLCVSMVAANEFASDKLHVNAHQSQSTVSDKGKKYSDYFLDNLDSMVASEMSTVGAIPDCKSSVTVLKSLDMFYSTSSNQKVEAGSGWVNHNFVAQCVAQSATTEHVEVAQITITLMLKALTKQQVHLERMGIEALIKWLEKTAGYTSNMTLPSVLASGGGNIGGVVGAIAMVAVLQTLSISATMMEFFENELDDLFKALGADTLNARVTQSLSRHNVDVEAKHKYGTKSECFMYPCFGASGLSYKDEHVQAAVSDKQFDFRVNMYQEGWGSSQTCALLKSVDCHPTISISDKLSTYLNDTNHFFQAMCSGTSDNKVLPNNVAAVIGADTFLHETPFRNENIGVSEPVFPTPPFQDYIIDADWQLSRTASVGMTTWISCKDTKIVDGEASNIVVLGSDFCGVATPYTAVEVKRGLQRKYMRPVAVTPQALLLNQTGFNCCYEEKAYHACDGYGYRLISWTGAPGLDKEKRAWQYSFLVNDRFKRSNKMPLNEFLGNFKSDPVIGLTACGDDKVFSLVTVPNAGKGLEAGTIGEDKSMRRYAIPIFTELLTTLPAVVKTISTIPLAVEDGITTLTSENRDLQSAYKAPESVDFSIGDNTYRMTSEYICKLQQTEGITTLDKLVPALGLTYLGATPYEAYFYSQATRNYYTYTGGSSLNKVDMLERFRDICYGRYDFINQEVLMPCLSTFDRLDSHVFDDDDETDNVIIPRLKGGKFIGEIAPPIRTMFNNRSWFKVYSMQSGLVYQGPNRCIINRFIWSDYMLPSIKQNLGKWQRLPTEVYNPFRKYRGAYEQVDMDVGDLVGVKGWTHNPFLLVTSPLGTSEQSDCTFEWEITFAWTVEMDKIYGADNYAVVCIAAETMTTGGKMVSRPTHVYLTKELFTRTGNYGYYSFRFQSRGGAGNRERLHIWSDQYIAVSSLQCEVKQVTAKRTEILTQQQDVQRLVEL